MSGMNGITINDKLYIYVPVENIWNCCGCCFKPEEAFVIRRETLLEKKEYKR